MSNNIDYTFSSKLFELVRERHVAKGYVYHYTDKKNIPHIFQSDALSFKLTMATDFDDKLEGECLNVFWDLALEEFVMEGIINDKTRSMLEVIKPANVGFLYKREDDSEKLFKSGPSTTYVGCFSMADNDDYMVQEYIKNDAHAGIRIKLDSGRMLDWTKKIGNFGYVVSIEPVLYGREVIDELKRYLNDLIEACGGVETTLFAKNAESLIKSKLLSMKYMAKTGRYRQENECRIILQVPNAKPTGYKGYIFEKVDGPKRGILFKIPKYALYGYEFKNMDDIAVKEAGDLIARQGYRVFHGKQTL